MEDGADPMGRLFSDNAIGCEALSTLKSPNGLGYQRLVPPEPSRQIGIGGRLAMDEGQALRIPTHALAFGAFSQWLKRRLERTNPADEVDVPPLGEGFGLLPAIASAVIVYPRAHPF